VHCPPSRAKLPKKKTAGHASWQTLVLVAGPGRLAGGPKAGVSSSPWYRRFSLQALRGFCSQAKQQQDRERRRERERDGERERERARERERYLPAASERHQSASAVLFSSRHVGGVERARGVLGKDPGGVVEERVGEGSETTVCAVPTTCCRCFGFCSGGLWWEKL
jgi:hypothetical protein